MECFCLKKIEGIFAQLGKKNCHATNTQALIQRKNRGLLSKTPEAIKES